MTYGFTTLDTIVVVAYLLAIVVFGILRGGKQASARDYFLGAGAIPWLVVCFSVVAAETSALTFISIPGLAYMSDLGFLQVAFGYLLGRIVVAFLFLPAFYKGELSTAYAFLEARFGRRTRRFASVVFLLTRIAADGVRLFATAIPVKLVLNLDYPTAILLLALVALLYTYFGGLRGVLWVDALQMVVYLGGALAAAFVLITRAGGWDAAFQLAQTAGKFKVFSSGTGQGFFQAPYTLVAGLAGGALLSMASHGTDQLVVQRLLAAKSLPASRKALIGSGVVIVFQFALFLLVGLLLYGYYGGRTPAELGLQRSDEIFPRFIVEGLPPGVGGFIMAGLFAAALSTVAGSMSSMSSSTVLDLLGSSRKENSTAERELKISRGVTILWAGLLVLSAIFFMNTTATVVELALSIASFTYGGLLGTFLLGMLIPRVQEREALAAFAAGILVMVLVISLKLVAWTWYTAMGVIVALCVGVALSFMRGSRPPGRPGGS